MKALSVKQPWAWLLVNGHKDIENRVWRTNLRGKVLIHAGQKFDDEFNPDYVPTVEGLPPWRAPEYQLGGIVGMVEIVDCVESHESPWFFGPFGFVIGKARPLPFYPVRGQLQFFDVEYPRELIERELKTA